MRLSQLKSFFFTWKQKNQEKSSLLSIYMQLQYAYLIMFVYIVLILQVYLTAVCLLMKKNWMHFLTSSAMASPELFKQIVL